MDDVITSSGPNDEGTAVFSLEKNENSPGSPQNVV